MEDFDRVRALWESGAGLGFAGEHTWVPVESTPLPALSSMERELYWGQSSVSSGPLLSSRRESTDDIMWDVVTVSLRGAEGRGPLTVGLWSSEELLEEIGIEEVDGMYQGSLGAPVDQDVWVGVTDEEVWAISSVHPASLDLEASCTGMSDADAVFYSDAL